MRRFFLTSIVFLIGYFAPEIYANSSLDVVKDNISRAISILHIARPDYLIVKNRLKNIEDQEGIRKNLDDFFRKDLQDPYSTYVPAEQNKNTDAELHNEHFGLGIEILDEKPPLLVSPYQNGPAYLSGLHDYTYSILALNGKAVNKSKDIIDIIDGSPMNGISVVFRSTVTGNEVLKSIRPEYYNILPVESRLSEDLPSIRIRSFKKGVTVKQLLFAIKQELFEKAFPLVLDLRGCDGGDLHESIEAATLFLKPDKKIVTTVDGLGIETVYRSPKTNTPITSRPVFILVDEFTASAGEVFVAALTYNQVAISIGSTTCGKCTSQMTLNFNDGSSLKMTDFKLHYPSGDYCAGRGIVPDIFYKDDQDKLKTILLNSKRLKKNKNIATGIIKLEAGRCGLKLDSNM